MNKTRNIGLDMARVAAIALVWIGHSGFFSIGMNPKVMEFWGGIFCLEVFFALSGFLVGRSMILTVTSRDPGPAFKKFYLNRLIRTIPLYYLVLLALWFITSQRPPLSCFLFLQNFSGEDLGYFPPSWSLPVEAWFYFLIPPVFFLLYRLFSRKHPEKVSVFAAIILLCLIPFLLRVWQVVTTDPTWDYGVRKQIPLRMDALMLGVLLSAVKLYAPEAYRKEARKHRYFLISVAGMAALYGWYLADLWDHFDDSNLGRILIFTLVPVLCCLLVAYLENSPLPEKLRGTFLEKGICGISSIGYSVYLVHYIVFQMVAPYFEGTGFLVSWLGFGLAIGISLVISYLTYRLIEQPLTRLRDFLLRLTA